MLDLGIAEPKTDENWNWKAVLCSDYNSTSLLLNIKRKRKQWYCYRIFAMHSHYRALALTGWEENKSKWNQIPNVSHNQIKKKKDCTKILSERKNYKHFVTQLTSRFYQNGTKLSFFRSAIHLVFGSTCTCFHINLPIVLVLHFSLSISRF